MCNRTLCAGPVDNLWITLACLGTVDPNIGDVGVFSDLLAEAKAVDNSVDGRRMHGGHPGWSATQAYFP
ncbi:hypothetical protein FRAAL0677 [Frankia alni ACN14a]|uniref:Uncharacterized protein n=1 Tax=Frankia alni (strain DSM 45986 / CECT 9034 / ACN14a) TaxID=326424 RepID=Q0RSV3_FRAAA|nr:hypothetical protein FRAAL0677 [Frankia alni ACN14a]